MNTIEKAAYLKGLAEGLGFDSGTKEGKLVAAVTDVIAELAEMVNNIDDTVGDISEAVDSMDDSIAELQSDVEDIQEVIFCDDDDDDDVDAETAAAAHAACAMGHLLFDLVHAGAFDNDKEDEKDGDEQDGGAEEQKCTGDCCGKDTSCEKS